MSYSNLNPLPGDRRNVIAAKMCQTFGGTPKPGDSLTILFRKAVEALGGTSSPTDNKIHYLRKILDLLDGTVLPGDNFRTLLRKIAGLLGIAVFPNDSQYHLLVKILQAIINQPVLTPVEDFVIRAGIGDAAQIAALNALYAGAMLNGWWDKCDLIYPFVGGTSGTHSHNLKSDLYPIVWSGTVTHDMNGITGDGSTGYGNTGYRPAASTLLTQNSSHISAYRRTAGNTGLYAGCGVSGASLNFGRLPAIPNAIGGAQNDDTMVDGMQTTVLGLVVGTRYDAADKHFYAGLADTTKVRASTGVPPSPRTLYILAWDNNGTATTFSTANLAGLTVGSGLTLGDYFGMQADWDAFNTALGRSV